MPGVPRMGTGGETPDLTQTRSLRSEYFILFLFPRGESVNVPNPVLMFTMRHVVHLFI